MNIFKSVLTLVLIIASHQLAWAHGEDQAGPHGGLIRMPGAFHTELIAASKNAVKVYLLDMEWKNPSTLKSSVEATLSDKNSTKASCGVKDNYYECVFPEAVNLSKKGELKILAQREGQKGAEAKYRLPLKQEKIDNEHGHH